MARRLPMVPSLYVRRESSELDLAEVSEAVRPECVIRTSTHIMLNFRATHAGCSVQSSPMSRRQFRFCDFPNSFFTFCLTQRIVRVSLQIRTCGFDIFHLPARHILMLLGVSDKLSDPCERCKAANTNFVAFYMLLIVSSKFSSSWESRRASRATMITFTLLLRNTVSALVRIAVAGFGGVVFYIYGMQLAFGVLQR
jgi:hypothetical protein